MQHNPNAIEIGNELLNRSFNRAEYRRLQGLKGAKEGLEAFDQGERLRGRQQDDAMRLQEFVLRRSNLERQNRLTDAQIADYESKRRDREADNARDPGAKLRAELNLRKQIADELGLRGDDRTYYIVNNRLREPNPEAAARLAEARENREQRRVDADERATNNAFMRYQTQLGVYNARKAALDEKARRAWDALQGDFEGEYYGDSKHTAVAFNRDSDEAKKAVLSKYEGRKQKLQSDLDAQYRDLGAPPQEPPILTRRTSSGTQTSRQISPKTDRKAASRAEIEAFARAKGMSVGEVERQLKANGYDIVAGPKRGR
jgi:hypothetical protein